MLQQFKDKIAAAEEAQTSIQKQLQAANQLQDSQGSASEELIAVQAKLPIWRPSLKSSSTTAADQDSAQRT